MKHLKNCVRFVETSACEDLESVLSLFAEIGRAIVTEGKFQKNRTSTRL